MLKKVVRKGEISLLEIINTQSINIVFQPILSLNNNYYLGIEALVRGINPETTEIISPLHLFEIAKEQGLVIELDRLCRKVAIEKFAQIHALNKELLLFMNIETYYVLTSILKNSSNTAQYHFNLGIRSSK